MRQKRETDEVAEFEPILPENCRRIMTVGIGQVASQLRSSLSEALIQEHINGDVLKEMSSGWLVVTERKARKILVFARQPRAVEGKDRFADKHDDQKVVRFSFLSKTSSDALDDAIKRQLGLSGDALDFYSVLLEDGTDFSVRGDNQCFHWMEPVEE